jgi:crotonobetainyl-CoA:carnitine CoA-transferase CaiB-like acyl-CoA transferase
MFDNLTEASLDRLNLGSDVIAKANPLLVRGTIRAFGTSGPYVNNPGFDQVIQAMSGLMVRQGGSGRPISTSYPIHDVTGGCLLALGSLAELYVRYTQRQSGRAWVTLASTAALIQSADMTTYAGRPARQTGGLDWRGPSSWHRYYQTADRWIGIAAETSEQREALLVVLQKGDLLQAEDAAREAVLVKEFEKSPASVWLKLLKEAKVPAAPVARQREFDMPHLAHARFAEDFQTEGAGMVKVPVSFVSWNGQLRREALSVENRHCDVKEVAADWTADRVLA